MGNSNSFMEKIYIYLPVIMLNSRMDYENPSTLRTLRMVYFVEQVRKVLLVSQIWSDCLPSNPPDKAHFRSIEDCARRELLSSTPSVSVLHDIFRVRKQMSNHRV